MSSLDDKLREILDEYGVPDDWQDKKIAQIKQAFAERYWLMPKHPNIYPDPLVMTGQEWLEKFVHALLEDGTYEEGDTEDLDKVMDAAREASGIKP